jgi:hypothetical protein
VIFITFSGLIRAIDEGDSLGRAIFNDPGWLTAGAGSLDDVRL